ncbi:SnoaL-like domain-containing protein [Nonlabens sp. Hel1_33_55]|uniref:nuclear transport factor 2 family protein n=1 Tax=Nonlabens sp. Hel1_33_55 TaxID=1336802 RepID=UPI000875E218|nr:nuclear transport factor 2 family protein [Nonlabens sp. Hel1_33_55]SCX97100.1 SnoaL-like domain-containing protein [Nonlabens sp. Hel1_33_55]
MNTQEVANKLVEYCRNNQFEKAYQELYSPDVISIEMSEPMKELHGMKEVEKKLQWRQENFEVEFTNISDPIVADNHFVLVLSLKSKNKSTGEQAEIDEIGVYQVKNGKILKEQFFYTSEDSSF